VFFLTTTVRPCAPRTALISRAQHANASARLSVAPGPVSRLRGGQAALDLEYGQGDVQFVGEQYSQGDEQYASTSTRQRPFAPFWLTGEEPPARKSVSEQGDMVMLQGFNWKILEDRRTLYTQLAEEMAPLAAAGVRTVWFPPPSESADVAGYLPSRWYNVTNRTLLDAAIKAAHDNGIVPMVRGLIGRDAQAAGSNSALVPPYRNSCMRTRAQQVDAGVLSAAFIL
jgi:hypothetical protein